MWAQETLQNLSPTLHVNFGLDRSNLDGVELKKVLYYNMQMRVERPDLGFTKITRGHPYKGAYGEQNILKLKKN